MMEEKYSFIKKALERCQEPKKHDQIHCGASLDEMAINFCSNDSLGLLKHHYVKKNAIKYVLEWGAVGHIECHQQVEENLAKLLGKESSLLFTSSHQAYQTVFSGIGKNGSLLLVDRFCHDELLQAASSYQGKVITYEHNDPSSLKELLEKHKDDPKIIVTESLFSFDGETCQLESLIELAKTYQALLCVDDSYSIGMMGKHGMGLSSHRDGVDVVMGSLEKACGCFGAYIACNELLKKYLMTFMPQMKETNTLPPAALGAISAVLELIPDMERERKKVLENSAWLREELINNDWDIIESTSHIISVACSSEEESQKLISALTQANISSASDGTSHIRFIINALHTQEQLQHLATTLRSVREESSLSIF